MRIAIVHSRYRSVLPSGENQIVEQQVAGLLRRGHEVILVARHSDDIDSGPLSRVRTAAQVMRYSGADPTAELERFAPDVVHVHNLFPNFGSEWLPRWPGPLVATLHNYRSVCASAVLSRDGKPCTLCPDGSTWAAVRHRCYRGSAAATAPLAWRTRHGVDGDPLIRRADALVVLSETARGLFERFGVPPDQLHLIPNGVADPGNAVAVPRSDRFVAAGRLSPEKGFDQLLRDWPADVPLDVIGQGPLYSSLLAIAGPSVRMLGGLPHEEFLRRLPGFRGMVIPGANLEGGLPMVMIEALAADVPLVARAGSVVAPTIERWGGGAVFTDAKDLRTALRTAANLPTGAARSVYQRFFTESGWLARLESLYEGLDRRTPRLAP